MCDSCGCSDVHASHADEESERITVLKDLLDDNARLANHNREHLDRHGIIAVNLMSAPGSGKTALLEATLDALADQYRMGVIVGDLATENDARRLRKHGVQAIQIQTGQGCHLDSQMVHNGLHALPLDDLDLVFIENVGNLVCPACFDLGQHYNVVLLSVTEGADKPAKYPIMFRAADLVLLTKSDLLPYIGEFQPERACEAITNLGKVIPVHEISARTGAGMDNWYYWLHRIALTEAVLA